MKNTLYYGNNLQVLREYVLSPHALAYASGADCANRQMRRGQRQHWSREDYNTAVVEYHRLHPCPNNVTCELCNCESKPEAAGSGSIFLF